MLFLFNILFYNPYKTLLLQSRIDDKMKWVCYLVFILLIRFVLFFEMESHVAQVDLKLSMILRN